MVFSRISEYFLAMQVIASLEEKNLPANAGDTRDMVSIPGSEKYPGGRNGNPFQYSCLGDPMDRGAWLAIVQRVTESQT